MKPKHVYVVEFQNALGEGVDSLHSRLRNALERAKEARTAHGGRFPTVTVVRYQIDKPWPSNFVVIHEWTHKRGIIWKHPIILARKKAMKGKR